MVSHLPHIEKDAKPHLSFDSRPQNKREIKQNKISLSNYDKHKTCQKTEVSSLSANKKELKPPIDVRMFTNIKNESNKNNNQIFLAPSAGIMQDPSVVSHLPDNEKDLKPQRGKAYVHKISEKSNKTNLSFQF